MLITKKECLSCKKVLLYNNFHKDKKSKTGFHSYCKKCNGKFSRNWRQNNPKKCRKTNRDWKKNNLERYKEIARNSTHKNYQIRRLIVLSHYGGNPPKCACCKEKEIKFLSIDHIKGGGGKHRKKVGGGGSLYCWLKRNNFPEGFQVLCFNCNMAKGFHGKCPHNVL